MCTFSTNKEELWPSIIEKAYMKLMGGYDFPGSKNFVRDNVWKRLLAGQKYGDALITIATGELTDADADAIGLVPTHAYAVLDIRETLGRRFLQVKNPWSHKRWTGPFSHMDAASWTPELMRALDYDYRTAAQKDDGIFWIDFDSMCANFDSIHMNWSPELFKYKSSIHSSYCLWTELPGHIQTMAIEYGPKERRYNPQFSLEVTVNDPKPAAVWLLLSKHITIKEENKDYITLHLYAGTNGERVFYPGNPMKEVRFNAPQGTSRYTIVVSQHEKLRSLNFTLRAYCMSAFNLMEVPKKYSFEQKIPGQWTEQTAGGNTSNATYMNNPQWRLTIPPASGPVAPGTLYHAMAILILEAPRTFAVHVKLVQGGKRVASVSMKDIVVQSGDYRHGFCYCEVPDLRLTIAWLISRFFKWSSPSYQFHFKILVHRCSSSSRRSRAAGDYTVVASTFEAGLLNKFFLTIGCSTKFLVTPIPLEGAVSRIDRVARSLFGRDATVDMIDLSAIIVHVMQGMFSKIVNGEWIVGVSAMGCSSNGGYNRNPRYQLDVRELTTVRWDLQLWLLHLSITLGCLCCVMVRRLESCVHPFRVRLQTPDIKPIPTTNVTIFERNGAGKPFVKEVATSGPYTNAIQGVATNDVVLTPSDRGEGCDYRWAYQAGVFCQAWQHPLASTPWTHDALSIIHFLSQVMLSSSPHMRRASLVDSSLTFIAIVRWA
ncbi:LOW QUALITY PROTEIN: hypothetical protein BC938DRAFT_475762 [Jimgerdemannia flammicorona]|uniref:Calpain catalytic domain-containing protein n=1 Tax=Jimgerdemannia flammicorona TaxID=994334 RepID=A0A433QRB6_9FUNG|nr:LOW QUALITY PROTEIN: hypothetical protein BC938DRAFT_475762 [Jimgerdemannia flammicorona]